MKKVIGQTFSTSSALDKVVEAYFNAIDKDDFITNTEPAVGRVTLPPYQLSLIVKAEKLFDAEGQKLVGLLVQPPVAAEGPDRKAVAAAGGEGMYGGAKKRKNKKKKSSKKNQVRNPIGKKIEGEKRGEKRKQ